MGFVCWLVGYLLNKPVQKLHKILSCSIGGIIVRLCEYYTCRSGRKCLSRASGKHCGLTYGSSVCVPLHIWCGL
jgi:hypothetical protein